MAAGIGRKTTNRAGDPTTPYLVSIPEWIRAGGKIIETATGRGIDGTVRGFQAHASSITGEPGRAINTGRRKRAGG
jgi:hypothetical protein